MFLYGIVGCGVGMSAMGNLKSKVYKYSDVKVHGLQHCRSTSIRLGGDTVELLLV